MFNLIVFANLATAAPATVLQHDVSYSVDRRGVVSSTIDWTVRIDDPSACAAGLQAPPGLHGATGGNAKVYNDLLLLPADTEPGEVFKLHSTQKGGSWSQSGYFRSQENVAVASASVTVEVAKGWPLHTWHDELATVEAVSPTHVEVRWTDIPEGHVAEFAWSAHQDWSDAGRALGSVTESRFGDREALGQVLAGSLAAVNLSALADRVLRHIELDLSRASGWSASRPVAEVVRSGKGSAHERALLITNLLRLAGYDARIGNFRPGSVSSAFPLTLPAPTALGEPLVAVRLGGKFIYLDPAASQTSVPNLPPNFRGGVAWATKSLPQPFPWEGVSSGTVKIVGNANAATNGDLHYRMNIQSEGTAEERLRSLLMPLDSAQRRERITQLLHSAHPGLEAITVEMSSVQTTSKRLQISITATHRKALVPIANGLRGEIHAFLAPAFAGWLPPDVHVEETLTLAPSGDLVVLAIDRLGSSFHPSVQIQRRVAHGDRLSTFATLIHHTRPHLSLAQRAASQTFLEEQRHAPHKVFLLPKDPRTSLKILDTDRTIQPLDRFTLKQLVLVLNRDLDGAVKAFKTASRKTPLDALLATVDQYERAGMNALWPALVDLPKSDSEVLGLARLLERQGLYDQAWEVASPLQKSPSPTLRLEALLMLERLHASAPPGVKVTSREALLDEARVVAPDDTRVILRTALIAIEQGDGEQALTILDTMSDVESDALGIARQARAMAMSHEPVRQVTLAVARARFMAPSDAEVARESAMALNLIGDLRASARHLMDAAKLRPTDVGLWRQAGDAFLTAGDLEQALSCYRQASDLEPQQSETAEQLLQAATWAGDATTAQLAQTRLRDFSDTSEVWPVPLTQLMPEVPEAYRVAVLKARPRETARSAELLEEQARWLLAQGRYEEATRDAMLLEYNQGLEVGRTLALRATLGLHRNQSRDQLLDAIATQNPEAGLMRLEWGLLSGDSELGRWCIEQEHAHAQALRGVLEAEDAVNDTPERLAEVPASFNENPWIGTTAGVDAWSHADLHIAVASWTGEATLPPAIDALFDMPLHDLYRLPDGTRVFQLEGSTLPMHGALLAGEEQSWISLARTPGEAVSALHLFQPSP